MHVKELLVRYMDLQRPNSRAGACTKKPAGGSMETHQDPTVRCMQANIPPPLDRRLAQAQRFETCGYLRVHSQGLKQAAMATVLQ